MTRSEMAFLMGLYLWYLMAAHNAPTHFGWLGTMLAALGYFTAPHMRLHFNANLTPREEARASTSNSAEQRP